MESSRHNGPYISMIFGKGVFFILYFLSMTTISTTSPS